MSIIALVIVSVYLAVVFFLAWTHEKWARSNISDPITALGVLIFYAFAWPLLVIFYIVELIYILILFIAKTIRKVLFVNNR